MAMLDDKVMEIAKELENVIAKLNSIGLNSCINADDDGTISVLMSKMPSGDYTYSKANAETVHDILKQVRYGNVVFETWISKAEAKKELLG